MADDTRENIIRTARRLFIQNGYTATSMREIAEQAGIGKATIYHHFQDKETIFRTLMRMTSERIEDSYTLIASEQDPCQRIRVAARSSLGFLYDTADLLQIGRREVPGTRDEMVSSFATLFRKYSGLLEDAFQKGMQTGQFREIDARATALTFLNMIQGNFSMYYLTGLRVDTPERTADRLLDVFFNGILASQTQQPDQPRE